MDRDAFLSKLRSDLDWFDDVGFQYNRDGTVEANALINGVVFHLYLGKCDGTGMGIQLINNAGRKMFGSYEEFCSKVKLYSYTHGVIVPDAKALAVIFDDEINQTSLYTGVGSMNGKSVAKFKLVGSDSFVVIGEKEESVYTASYITNDNKLIFSQDYFVDDNNEFHKVATWDDYTRCLVKLYGDSAEFDIDKVSKNRYTVTSEGMKIGYDVFCQDDEYFFEVYSVNGEEVQYRIQLKNPYSLEELFQQVRQMEGNKLAQLDVSADDLFDDAPEVIEGSPEEPVEDPEEATEEPVEEHEEPEEPIEEPVEESEEEPEEAEEAVEEPKEATKEPEESVEEPVEESEEVAEAAEESEELVEETEETAQEESEDEPVVSEVIEEVEENEQSNGYEAEEPVEEEAAEIESIVEHEEPETASKEEEPVEEAAVEEFMSEESESAEEAIEEVNEEPDSFVSDHMADYFVSEERPGEDDDVPEESHEAVESEQAAVQAEDVPNTVESKLEEAVMDDFSIKTLEGEGVEVYMDGVLYLVPEGILKASGIPSEIFTEKDVRASRFGVSLTGMERVHKTFLVHVTEENSSAVVSGMLSRLFS